MVFDYLFLPALFIIGIITAYEDLKYGKVRNKWVIAGLFWGVFIIFLFALWSLVAEPITRFFHPTWPVFTISFSYLGNVVLNSFMATLVAFFMWRLGAWAAGDAKLFIVFSLLLPLKYYWQAYFHFFPSFVLLINIFLSVFIYLFIRACLFFVYSFYLKFFKGKEFKKRKKIKREKGFVLQKIKNQISVLLFFISIFMVFGLFRETIELYLSVSVESLQIFVFGMFIVFSGFLFGFFQKKFFFWVALFIFVLVLGTGLFLDSSLAWRVLYSSVKTMLIFMIVFSFFRIIIDFYVAKTSVRIVPLENLSENTNLFEIDFNKIKEDKDFYKKYFSRVYPDGLTGEQVVAVKKWAKEKQEFLKGVRVYQPFSFVPWMFLGLVITIILRSSLIHLVF